jgi:hypothetical protein
VYVAHERDEKLHIWARKPEEKRLLGRPRHRWDDNFKLDFKETEYKSMEWIQLALGRVQKKAFVKMNHSVQ